MAVTADDHSFILLAKTHPCPRRITDRRNHRAGLQMRFLAQCRSLGHQLRDHTPSRRYRKHTFSCFLDLKLNTISLKHSIVNRISPPPPYLLFVRAICFSDRPGHRAYTSCYQKYCTGGMADPIGPHSQDAARSRRNRHRDAWLPKH